jgi:hypothetical protein
MHTSGRTRGREGANACIQRSLLQTMLRWRTALLRRALACEFYALTANCEGAGTHILIPHDSAGRYRLPIPRTVPAGARFRRLEKPIVPMGRQSGAHRGADLSRRRCCQIARAKELYELLDGQQGCSREAHGSHRKPERATLRVAT